MPEITRSAANADRVLDLFAEARELPSGERARYLERVCDGEDGLIEEVLSLLQYESQAEGFLAKPVIDNGATILAEEAGGGLGPDAMLGEYRIVSLLGAGGMGEVYLAEDTVHGRRVALKLIGNDRAADVRGRHFRHERRVLAGLNHPSIARLYGSGVTPEGQAYLVMEYVEGERLDDFYRTKSLDIGERLTLFRQVCAAVTHAHQNLVVHRDLKPANIRVTPTGEPKLLDFGIAKLLDPGNDPTRTDLPTLTMGAMMTPEYASPEQLREEVITTASDVYSLGVILYEMLSGQRPYRFRNRQAEEIARTICEQEPMRLSMVIDRGVATEKCGVHEKSPARLRRQLKGDLDNIVAMALRKEPARRYASVAQLSEDIRRHCDGQPVVARKDTWNYRAGKFVRRNKIAVIAAVGLVTLLIVGFLTTMWQARTARQERDRALLAQAQSDRLNHFLQDLLASADPAKLGKDVKVVQVLDAASKTVDLELAGEPEILAQAHATLSRAYSQLAVLEPMEQHARQALSIVRRLHGNDDPATLEAELNLADALNRRLKFEEAEPLLRELLAAQRRAKRTDIYALSNTLRLLGNTLMLTNRTEAEPVIAESLSLVKAARGGSSKEYVRVLNMLAVLKLTRNDFAGAETQFRRVIDLYDGLSVHSLDSINPQLNLCVCLGRQQKWSEMRTALNRLKQDCTLNVGENNMYYASAMTLQACLDFQQGDYLVVIHELRQSLDIIVATFPANNRNVVQVRGLLGVSLTRTGHAADGEPLLRAAYIDGKNTERFPFQFTFGNVESALGECLLAEGRYAEAEGLLTTGYDDLRTRLGAQNYLAIRTARFLYDLYTAWNRPAEAARYASDPVERLAPTIQ